MPLDVRVWDCPNCGISHDRDINASKNILAAGLAVSVCGSSVRPDRESSKGHQSKTVRGESSTVLGSPQEKQLANPKGKKQKPKS